MREDVKVIKALEFSGKKRKIKCATTTLTGEWGRVSRFNLYLAQLS